MTIKQGDTLPSATLFRLGTGGVESFDIAEAAKGKTLVLVGIPGAFTPACQEKHLPGYVENAAQIKAGGVDEIICVAVNDVFVLKAFSEKLGAEGKVTFWSDGNADLAKALGLTLDGSGKGLATRLQRFLMRVENGKVTMLEVEPAAGEVTVTGVASCMLKRAA